MPLTVQTLTSFTRNFSVDDAVKIAALIETHHNSSSEVPEDEEHKLDGASGGDFKTMKELERVVQEPPSSEVVKNDRKEQKIIEASSKKIEVLIRKKIEQKTIKECDLTRGRWVFDESYPLYTKDSCPFIDEGFDCEGNRRLDRNYFKWRWQPQGCDLQRYYYILPLHLSKGPCMFCYTMIKLGNHRIFHGSGIYRNKRKDVLEI